MEFNIKDRIIFLTMHGSHAYGMAREGSDIDVKGIAIPPKEYFLGFSKKFEQYESTYDLNDEETKAIQACIGREILPDEKLDSCIYDIRKFFYLASQCNPNIIEVLFTHNNMHIISDPIMQKLIANRDLFLSTRANFRFRGYAFSQLKRIKRHRRWLLSPPDKKPERKDFGLPLRTVIPADQLLAAESLIKKKVEEWVFEQEEMTPELLASVRNRTINSFKELFTGLRLNGSIVDEYDRLDPNVISNAAGELLGYSSNFLELLDMERRYKASSNEYKQFKNWEKHRNPVRAKMEKKFGLDTKHSSHLVRLLKMSKEIISEGKVIVCRPDADELLAIRDGAWKYEDLIEWATKQDEEIQEIYDSGKSPLSKKPKLSKLNNLCIEMVEEFNGK